ncbi:MAG: chorismate synthase [Lachnospiraceae bacterium]|nr:chorismate synthase [Lachnospiraceae bacterium]
MSGSSFGKLFRVTTWGESHGPALGCVIDGCPAGLRLSPELLQPMLDRRKPGTSSATTARKEDDLVEILSGVFEGFTTGTPISLLIRNTSQISKDYGNLADTYRPGHADYCYDAKYGIRDYRGGGRSSGRETAARVAAGAVASLILEELGIRLRAYTTAIGSVTLPEGFAASLSLKELAAASANPVCMPSAEEAAKALALVEEARSEKDSLGGVAECRIEGVPAGIGEPVFDKLDAVLGQAVFSIGGVKAVEIGDGIAAAKARGSENNDCSHMENGKVVFETNHAGGILGGISNGAPILLRAHFKPTPSIFREQKTVNKNGEDTLLTIAGRHDPVIVPRAVVVVESMCAIALLDLLLENNGSRMDRLSGR